MFEKQLALDQAIELYRGLCLSFGRTSDGMHDFRQQIDRGYSFIFACREYRVTFRRVEWETILEGGIDELRPSMPERR